MIDHPTLKDNDILNLFKKTFPEWFTNLVNQLDSRLKQKFLKDFTYGCIFQVKLYETCFTNEYRFTYKNMMKD